MNIGIDIDGTITAKPKFFKELSRRIRAEGGKVFIVSARLPVPWVYKVTEKELKALGIEYDELHLIPDEGIKGDIPGAPDGLDWYRQYLWQKVAFCLAHGVELFFDDDDTVVELFEEYGEGIEIRQVMS